MVDVGGPHVRRLALVVQEVDAADRPDDAAGPGIRAAVKQGRGALAAQFLGQLAAKNSIRSRLAIKAARNLSEHAELLTLYIILILCRGCFRSEQAKSVLDPASDRRGDLDFLALGNRHD